MTPVHFQRTLHRIGWSGRELGRRLGYQSPAQVSEFTSGLKPIPEELAAWMTELADLIERYPAPRTFFPRKR